MPDPRADEHEGAVAVREAAHDARAPPDLPVEPFDHVAGAYPPAVPVRELRQQVRGRLADPPAQAVGRGLQPPAFHLRGDLFGLGEGRLPGFHGEHGPQRRGSPIPVAWRRLRKHVAHEVHHAPPASRLGEHGG